MCEIHPKYSENPLRNLKKEGFSGRHYLRGGSWNVENEFLKEVALTCIESALPNTNYILRPPHGYKFRKPSGQIVDQFFRAGNLLSEARLLPVFSFLLLRELPQSTRIIYIDSFTILSFALRIQSLIAYFSNLNDKQELAIPTIEIFSSYNIESDFRLSNSDEYYIIISASTSYGLAQKLITTHNAIKSRIIHLLGIGSSDSDLSKNSIFFEDRNIETAQKSDRVIGITTEEFMVSHGNPRCVRITRKHVSRKHANELKDPFYQECLQIRKKAESSGYGPYSTFAIDSNSSCDYWSEGFSAWLKYELIHDLPKTTSTIFYLDDSMSKRMTLDILNRLREVTDKGGIQIFPVSEISERMSDIQEDSTIAIVAIQDPGLAQFGRVSMQLRERPDLYQHYVLGYSFAESRTLFTRMTNDLKLAPESMPKYMFSNFLLLPIGSADFHKSIISDYGINRTQTETLNQNIAEKTVCRLSEGGKLCNSESNQGIFFTKLNGEKLTLRGGSIFFTIDSTNEANEQQSAHPNVSQEVVYLAVSLAIQQARDESNSLASDLKFDQNPFVKTVIDPQMFWRFNDGILQATLLRVLSNSELDFASSEKLSGQFREFTNSVLTNANYPAGEAALEFLSAVVSKKVSLTNKDWHSVQETAMSDNKLKTLWEYFSLQQPF